MECCSRPISHGVSSCAVDVVLLAFFICVEWSYLNGIVLDNRDGFLVCHTLALTREVLLKNKIFMSTQEVQILSPNTWFIITDFEYSHSKLRPVPIRKNTHLRFARCCLLVTNVHNIYTKIIIATIFFLLSFASGRVWHGSHTCNSLFIAVHMDSIPMKSTKSATTLEREFMYTWPAMHPNCWFPYCGMHLFLQ